MVLQGCFSNPTSPTRTKPNVNVNVAPVDTCKSKESLITCIYLTRLLDSPIHLTLTWSKTPSSHSLTIYAPDRFSFTLSLRPSFFRARSGSKSIPLDHPHKLRLYYDFTRAESTRPNSAEPEASSFYIALVCDGRVTFSLGELTRRVGPSQRVDSVLVSRREHVFGRRTYATRAELAESARDVEIECTGGAMKVRIDGETVLTVKRLTWKFRGNEKITINGVGVDFYWDVFNWVENGGKSSYGGPHKNGGNGVFVFQIGDGGVCPEMVGPEKKLMRKNSPSLSLGPTLSPTGSCSSVWQWAEESSDCGRSSSGSSSITTRSSGSFGGSGGGFSLVLYAWRRE